MTGLAYLEKFGVVELEKLLSTLIGLFNGPAAGAASSRLEKADRRVFKWMRFFDCTALKQRHAANTHKINFILIYYFL